VSCFVNKTDAFGKQNKYSEYKLQDSTYSVSKVLDGYKVGVGFSCGRGKPFIVLGFRVRDAVKSGDRENSF
jgi:hypothetical protein